MDLTLAQLRTLRELERLGTMGAVATSLDYTHGAISQQLAALERAVGFELTAKNGRRVVLTDAGSILAKYAGTILESVQDAIDALESTRTQASGPVRLGVFASTAATLLPAAISLAADRYPGLTITTQELGIDDASAAVRRSEVDVAFGLDYTNAPIRRDEGIEHVLLRTEMFSLAVTETHIADVQHASIEQPFDLSAAADWDWILPPAHTHYGLALRVACRRAGFEPRVAHEVTDTAASLTMVARGLGVVPVTPMMLDLVPSLTLTTVPIRQEIDRHVILARRLESVRRPTVDALVEILRETVRGVGKPFEAKPATHTG